MFLNFEFLEASENNLTPKISGFTVHCCIDRSMITYVHVYQIQGINSLMLVQYVLCCVLAWHTLWKMPGYEANMVLAD